MSRTRRTPERRWNYKRVQPPHCPNRKCAYYRPHPGWLYCGRGFFSRKGSTVRFPRFLCLACNRSFSTRTFAADYWLRRRDLYPRITQLSVQGPGLRQMGRYFGVTHDTIGRHLSRAGRQSILVHQEILRESERANGNPEPWVVVLDGFETFEYSQFFPFHMNLAVGAESWFVHGFTDSPLRRKGCMTAKQKRMRILLEKTLGRPSPKAVENGMYRLVRNLLEPLRRRKRSQAPTDPALTEGVRERHEEADRDLLSEDSARSPSETPVSVPELLIHSDDHPAYPRAFRRLKRLPYCPAIRHTVTSSRERRTTSNPLFPVNLTDLLLRHSQANHRRETIAFSKRRQGAMERAAIFLVWRNYIKRKGENRAGTTSAMAAGVLDRPLQFAQLYQGRRFPTRDLLPLPWWSYYWRSVRTRALGTRQTKHRLGYAF